MSWQEEEIKKRREAQEILAQRERERIVCASHVKELWGMFLRANEHLPAELKLAVSREESADGSHHIESIIGKSNIDYPYYDIRSVSFDPVKGTISYKVSGACHGGPAQTSEYEILYNEDEGHFFTCSEYAARRYRHQGIAIDNSNSFLIDVRAIETIIRNLCKGAYNITEDLERIHPVPSHVPQKRRKFLGIF
jgi:hypothetical protein